MRLVDALNGSPWCSRGEALVLVSLMVASTSASGCAPRSPPNAQGKAASATDEPQSGFAHSPATMPAGSEPQPKDDPASCIDPDLRRANAWNEEQIRRLDAQLLTESACHRAALKKNPTLEGKLHLLLNYEKGDPKPMVHVASSIDDCELAACIQRLASKAIPHTDPPKTSFVYTLEFSQARPPTRSQGQEPFRGEYCARNDLDHSGHLAPVVIQTVVREHYGKFRACYEQGLARDPRLSGRITVRFVIARDGTVSSAMVSDNEIPDCGVARCMIDAYKSLQFQKPEGGTVTVVYPVVFAPG